MKSRTTRQFWRAYRTLPNPVRRQAVQAYRLWRADPSHPGLRFKRVHASEPIYSLRIGLGWRALGLRDGETVTWFWIGSHADYDRLLSG